MRRRDFTLVFFLSILVASVADSAPISYAYQVRPILSDKCFACHGPDAAKREADVRLDTVEGATAIIKDTKSRVAITPGHLDASEAWQRIISSDPEAVMPPPKSHLVLSQEEKDILKQWIIEGAKYEPHWAFQPLPASVPLPAIKIQNWAKNPIDHFIAAKIEQQQLQPSPAAPPARWLRRVSLDLNGLAPTWSEVEQFAQAVAEKGEDAYAAAVDRLLASPRFGEHLAVGWLDAARYADSYGYQTDNLSPYWPWRDWVIRALNQNMPYDRFITWQIAGDLLPNATREQQLASAFNRLHRLTNEGGSIPLEHKVNIMADRLSTFGTVFLALTLECSRCHDHKYDPISMRDFYSMGAFFTTATESGVYDRAAIVPSPSILLPTAEQETKLASLREAARLTEEQWQRACNENTAWQQWIATTPSVPLTDAVAYFSFDDDGETANNAISNQVAKTANMAGVTRIDSPHGRAVSFDGDAGVSIPNALQCDRHEPFSVHFQLRDGLQNPQSVVVLHASRGTDVGFSGPELLLTNGHLEAALVRSRPGNAIAIRSIEPVITKNEWFSVGWTYDGSSNAQGLKLYVNGKAIATQVVANHVHKKTQVAGTGTGHLELGARFRERGLKDGAIDELRIFSRELSAPEIEALSAPASWQKRIDQHDETLRQTYCSAIDPSVRALAEQMKKARELVINCENEISEIGVMDDQPEACHVLERGNYDAPRTPNQLVQRNTFTTILPQFPDDAPRNRLGLAQWLTQPNHPLTSRVYVNRVWQQLFGTGIVSTAENFGLQGALPSHPELLDWLSRQFVNDGWNIKALYRTIVLSATYRQDSVQRPDLQERDPANQLLARSPSLRLSGEQIRDLALQAADLLKEQIGGPPAYPYQPGPDLWRESNAMTASYKEGEVHRRSVYSVWKRTSPLPNISAFDAPTRESCVVHRSQTNTPLQALVLLNDPQFVESARVVAQTCASLPESERLKAAFARYTSRQPTRKELELLDQLYREQLSLFQKDPEAAKKILAIGKSASNTQNNHAEVAALTVTCQAILNLDATIWKR